MKIKAETLEGYAWLFGKYLVSGFIAYPIELFFLYALTEYVHIWYIFSDILGLLLAYLIYFCVDVLFGVIRYRPKS